MARINMDNITNWIKTVSRMVERKHLVRGGCVVGVVAFLAWTHSGLARPVLYLAFTAIGVTAGLWTTLVGGSGRTHKPDHSSAVPTHFRSVVQEKSNQEKCRSLPKQPLLISKSVDGVLNEILDIFLQEYVVPWYRPLVSETDGFLTLLRQELWVVLENFKTRLERVNGMKLLTQDVVVRLHEHFRLLRLATSTGQEKMPYKLYPFLRSPAEELEHLRKVSELLLVLLLPGKYARLPPLRHLLREIIAKFLLSRLIQTWSDPEHLNRKILDYLHWQQVELERSTRTYTVAETYEDFIHIINRSSSIEELKGLRIYIVTEMMQASAITNLKRAKGIKVDKEYSPQMTTKGELLQSRNLRQYINQLRFAKWTCEKRIKVLGGPNYLSPVEGWPHGEDEGPVPGKKVLSLSVILQSPYCREYLARYLEREDSHSLVRFWEAVEEMKSANKTCWHQLANHICQTYINNSNSSVKLSKNILMGMKEFLLANTGPEAFLQAQKWIFKLLDDKFYPSFIVSTAYNQMMTDAEKKGLDFSKIKCRMEEGTWEEEVAAVTENDEVPGAPCLSEQNRQSRTRLSQLDEKYRTKQQALQALLSSSKTESSKMVAQLEQEVEEIRQELDHLEWYIRHTDMWIQHLGHWRATVQNVETIKEEGDKTVLYATITVDHRQEPDNGWAVARSVQAFHTLHAKLSQISPSLRKMVELPSATKPRFKNCDDTFLQKIKAHLQHFLTIIMNDEAINANENIFIFLNSSSSDLHKDPFASPKKSSKFAFLNFFKSSQSSNASDISQEEEDDFFLLDDADREDRKDSIAEPLYLLISEVFDLAGVFNWLRRTLITIVQITFGKTINKQIRETVSWLTAEPMILSYVQHIRNALHPSPRSADRASLEEVRDQAKQLVLNNIPEVLCHVVGQQNARKGVTKVLDAMQNQTLNKHLVYSLLEAFIYEFAPELQP